MLILRTAKEWILARARIWVRTRNLKIDLFLKFINSITMQYQDSTVSVKQNGSYLIKRMRRVLRDV